MTTASVRRVDATLLVNFGGYREVVVAYPTSDAAAIAEEFVAMNFAELEKSGETYAYGQALSRIGFLHKFIDVVTSSEPPLIVSDVLGEVRA